jgi:hypothetical protein
VENGGIINKHGMVYVLATHDNKEHGILFYGHGIRESQVC